MKKIKIVLLLLIILLGINIIYAKDGDSRFLPLPIFGSTPETGFIFGGAGLYLQDKTDGQFLMSAGAMYTENEQTNVFLKIDNEFKNYSVLGQINYQNWVSKYYGVGNNTRLEDEEIFTRKNYSITLEFSRKLKKNKSAGIIGSYENYKINVYKIDPNLTGNRGVALLGLGITFSLDTRDRKLNTKTGYYFNYKLLEYFSSRNNNKFLKNHIDYRYFYNIYKEHTLGVHAIFDNNFGEIPFQKMVSLGNAYNMRGFLEGRYIDKNKAAVQMEYRFPVFKWFSGVIFTGFGEVYDKTFKLDELKNSYGAGLRFNYDKEKGITIRFDMAFNGEDSRVYVNFREAF